MKNIDHIAGYTYHGRKGAIENAFRYSVDYILLDPEADLSTPLLFSVDRVNITNWRSSDHGGEPGQGIGAPWLRARFEELEVPQPAQIMLLTQPRVLGHVFNPVSFWFCFDRDRQLYAVVAEVTNTYGTRHSYVCHKPGFAVIDPSDRVVADKLMHVSPFQKIEGNYTFRFDYRPDRVGVWIDYGREGGGLIATLTGPRQPLTNRSILWSLLRRPFGARRTFVLIVWQAIKLWIKKARFRPFRTAPVPDQPVSRVRR
ncbi:DUF1365 domain-containing protein [Ruegeria profundi]|uniref:DUF1365 domain-containing protein n=1 Tax=Ruegeria profundi TaxID=1685378 RepID=UPI003C7E793A